jgi:hypothetical protein
MPVMYHLFILPTDENRAKSFRLFAEKRNENTEAETEFYKTETNFFGRNGNRNGTTFSDRTETKT